MENKKQFNLSEKIFGSEDFDNEEFKEIKVLHIDSVKEFIKRLKEEAELDEIDCNIVDKLLGDKFKELEIKK